MPVGRNSRTWKSWFIKVKHWQWIHDSVTPPTKTYKVETQSDWSIRIISNLILQSFPDTGRIFKRFERKERRSTGILYSFPFNQSTEWNQKKIFLVAKNVDLKFYFRYTKNWRTKRERLGLGQNRVTGSTKKVDI